MIILGIETSCDETAAAVVQKDEDRVTILSNVVASSAALQAKYGGVIPEQAAREQIKSIIPIIQEALVQSNLYPPSSKHHLPSSIIHPPAIDAIAVTYGPGLIGSLLVGVETAKTLANIWNKPLIPVNHLIGHFYANWVSSSSLRDHEVAKQSGSEYNPTQIATSPTAPRNDKFQPPTFPCLGLLISGGHTDLVLFKDHGKYEYLGGTRDDAAGECFDKCARLLGLPYPGGPEIARLATRGDAAKFNLPRPMIDSKDFDFSFSGLKTAVANTLQGHSLSTQGVTLKNSSEVKADLAASIEQAIIDVLVTKTLKAAKKYGVNQIIVAGGVAANQKLASELKKNCQLSILNCQLFIPPPNLCTDNAAMIATAALFNYHPTDPLTLQANPNLNLSG